jgi:hypothetical protein
MKEDDMGEIRNENILTGKCKENKLLGKPRRKNYDFY